MRRTISMLLVAGVALGLAACDGGAEDVTAGEETEGAGSVTTVGLPLLLPENDPRVAARPGATDAEVFWAIDGAADFFPVYESLPALIQETEVVARVRFVAISDQLTSRDPEHPDQRVSELDAHRGAGSFAFVLAAEVQEVLAGEGVAVGSVVGVELQTARWDVETLREVLPQDDHIAFLSVAGPRPMSDELTVSGPGSEHVWYFVQDGLFHQRAGGVTSPIADIAWMREPGLPDLAALAAAIRG